MRDFMRPKTTEDYATGLVCTSVQDVQSSLGCGNGTSIEILRCAIAMIEKEPGTQRTKLKLLRAALKRQEKKESPAAVSSHSNCPKCGAPFDRSEHCIYECPRCHIPGSTACCNPGGNNCLCIECEERG